MLKQFMKLGAIKLLALILNLVNFTIIVRVLEINQLGNYAFASALIPVITIFFATGIHNLVNRAVSQNASNFRNVSPDVYKLITIYHTLGIIIFAILTFLVLTGHDVLLPLIVVSISLLQARMSINVACQKGFSQPVVGEFVKQIFIPTFTLFNLLFLSFATQLELDATKILLLVLLSNLSGAIVIERSTNKFWSSLRRYENSDPSQYSLGDSLQFLLLALIAALTANIITIYSGIAYGENAAGYIRISERLGSLLAVPAVVLNLYLMSELSRAFAQKDFEKSMYLLQTSVRIALPIVMAALCLYYFFGYQVLELLFTKEIADQSFKGMMIVGLSNFLSVAFGPLGVFLVALGHEKAVVKIEMTFICLLIIFTIALDQFLSIQSMLYTFAFSKVFKNLVLSVYLWRLTGVKPGFLILFKAKLN